MATEEKSRGWRKSEESGAIYTKCVYKWAGGDYTKCVYLRDGGDIYAIHI
jgi:hypothetical protein